MPSGAQSTTERVSNSQLNAGPPAARLAITFQPACATADASTRASASSLNHSILAEKPDQQVCTLLEEGIRAGTDGTAVVPRSTAQPIYVSARMTPSLNVGGVTSATLSTGSHKRQQCHAKKEDKMVL